MRTLIGWTSALVASALLGALVYSAFLTGAPPQAASEVAMAPPTESPLPTPTVYRTEERIVVDPTPTVTVDVPVTITKTEQPRGTAPSAANVKKALASKDSAGSSTRRAASSATSEGAEGRDSGTRSLVDRSEDEQAEREDDHEAEKAEKAEKAEHESGHEEAEEPDAED